MKAIFRSSVLGALVFAFVVYGADTLKLRDGRTLSGRFAGATEAEIWFQPDGRADLPGTLAFPVDQVSSVAFDGALKPLGPSSGVKPAVHQDVREEGAPRLMAMVRSWIAALPFSGARVSIFALARSQK
jgi:hypothetical protein